MTTAAFNLIWDNTSDANFRAWASALDTQILAMGWVHATDTGQANLATMVRSAVTGANYVIYKTNDGVSPALILKISYATGGGGSGSPGFYVQAGFATDGAGNITGTQQTVVIQMNGFNDTIRTCVISGSSSRLAFTINMNNTSPTSGNSFHVAIERNKTSAGVDTNTGMIFAVAAGSNMSINGVNNARVGFLYLPTSGGVPAYEYAFPAILTNNPASSNTYGATTGAAVPIPLAGAAQNPGLNHLVCTSTEMPTRDTTVTVAMYDGSNHTYYAIGPNWISMVGVASAGGVGITNTRLLQRYD